MEENENLLLIIPLSIENEGEDKQESTIKIEQGNIIKKISSPQIQKIIEKDQDGRRHRRSSERVALLEEEMEKLKMRVMFLEINDLEKKTNSPKASTSDNIKYVVKNKMGHFKRKIYHNFEKLERRLESAESRLPVIKKEHKTFFEENKRSKRSTNVGKHTQEELDIELIQKNITELSQTISNLRMNHEAIIISLQDQINRENNTLHTCIKECIQRANENFQASQTIGNTFAAMLSAFSLRLDELKLNQDRSKERCEIMENSIKDIQISIQNASQPKNLNDDIRTEVSSQLGIFLLKLDEFYKEKLSHLQNAFQDETQKFSADLNKLKEDTVVGMKTDLCIEKEKIENFVQYSKDIILTNFQTEVSKIKNLNNTEKKFNEEKLSPEDWYKEAIKVIEKYPPIHKENVMKYLVREMDPAKIAKNVYYRKYVTAPLNGRPDDEMYKLKWNNAEFELEPDNIDLLKQYINMWFTKKFIDSRTVEAIREQLLFNYKIDIGVGGKFPYRITYLSHVGHDYQMLARVLKCLLKLNFVIYQLNFRKNKFFRNKIAFTISIANNHNRARVVFLNNIKVMVKAKNVEIERCLRSNAMIEEPETPAVEVETDSEEYDWSSNSSLESIEPPLNSETRASWWFHNFGGTLSD